jgi:hypothetical protein
VGALQFIHAMDEIEAGIARIGHMKIGRKKEEMHVRRQTAKFLEGRNTRLYSRATHDHARLHGFSASFFEPICFCFESISLDGGYKQELRDYGEAVFRGALPVLCYIFATWRSGFSSVRFRRIRCECFGGARNCWSLVRRFWRCTSVDPWC